MTCIRNLQEFRKQEKLSATIRNLFGEYPQSGSHLAPESLLLLAATESPPFCYCPSAKKPLNLSTLPPYPKNPVIGAFCRKDIAEALGDITEDGVKYHFNKLKKEGIIKRVGPDKGGHWKILKTN